MCESAEIISFFQTMEPELADQENQQAHEPSHWNHLKNHAKRYLAPVAIAAAGLLPMAQAMESPAEAIAGRTHPVLPFRNYDQDDWGGRFPSQGCGPTSSAMVFGTLTDSPHLTPRVIGRELPHKYWPSGMFASGFHYLAEKYGTPEKADASWPQVKETLRDGGLAIIHAQPGHFTSAGHYMVIKSMDDGRFRLADPNGAPGRDSEKRWWSARQLESDGVDEAWAFMPSETIGG